MELSEIKFTCTGKEIGSRRNSNGSIFGTMDVQSYEAGQDKK